MGWEQGCAGSPDPCAAAPPPDKGHPRCTSPICFDAGQALPLFFAQQLGRTLCLALLCSALLPGSPAASCCTLLPHSPPEPPKHISVAPGGAGMGSIKLFLISFLFLLQSPGTRLLQPLQPNDGIIQLYDTASVFLPSTAESKWHCSALRVELGGRRLRSPHLWM